jgi:DNA-binding NarL/FixJ family response regulator
MSQKTKILLVDDHPLVREWLANLINEQPDLEVCGETGDAGHAFHLIGGTAPAVAIVDLSLEGGSGIELIKSVKAAYPGVAMIVLSMHEEELYAERALRAGARGYIMKREATKKILQAIRAVLAGQSCVSDGIARRVAAKSRGSAGGGSGIDELSDRELEIFQLLGCGMNTRQIADHLHIGFKTVQTYNARIKEKLQLDNATQLLHEAIRLADGPKTPRMN